MDNNQIGGMRLQSSLGGIQKEQRKDLNMEGVLMMGEVIKVYRKYHTADVKLVNRNYGALVGSSSVHGKLSCKIMENFAGYDNNLGVAFGSATPIQKGCTVILGFVGNKKAQPVILGCIHNPEILKNNLIDYPENDESSAEELQYYKLFMDRLQNYFFVNNKGEFEFRHISDSFVKFSENELNDTRQWGYSYRDLSIKNKQTKTPIRNSESTFKPFSLLAVLRDKFDDLKSTFLRILISGSKVRISRDTENDLVFLELDDAGNFRIKQQYDTPNRDESNSYTEFKFNREMQAIEVTQKTEEGETKITATTKSGISIDSKKPIEIHSAKSISIFAVNTIDIDARNVNISVDDED